MMADAAAIAAHTNCVASVSSLDQPYAVLIVVLAATSTNATVCEILLAHPAGGVVSTDIAFASSLVGRKSEAATARQGWRGFAHFVVDWFRGRQRTLNEALLSRWSTLAPKLRQGRSRL